jgi:regulator of RNase E activity RraA
MLMQDAMVLTESLKSQLASVSTSTLTHRLQMRGINNAFFTGLTPLHRNMRMVGRARTVRYVALREDLQRSYSGAGSAQQKAVETIEPGEVLVIEARGAADAGTIGDMYSTRAFIRGAAGIISDGALRDTPAITALSKPIYHQGSHGATLGRRHMPFSFNEPITCAGVFVVPGDVIVGDGEGAVVIPAALAEEVARDAIAQEEIEAFALERITAGESSFGLFPLAPSRREEFTTWANARKAQPMGTGPSRGE